MKLLDRIVYALAGLGALCIVAVMVHILRS